MGPFIINLIQFLVWIITILVIVQVFLSYFMSPYHPVRLFIDRLMNPLLNPIRRIMPQTGMLDLSPMVLIIVVQILGYILQSLLISFLR